jgi:membrane fusion protein
MTTSSLFRKEALEHRKDRLYGDVILLQPLSMTVLVGVVVMVSLMILSILFWGTYARKEKVVGYLFPDKGIVKTYAPQAGNVFKVHVREGDEVQAGQVLITIVSERGVQGSSDIDTVQLNELETTVSHLKERIQGEKALLISETTRLQNQIEATKKELVQIEQSLKAQEDRVKMLGARVASVKQLVANKNMSEMDYQKIYDEYLVQKQRYQDLVRAKLTAQNNIEQAQSQLDQLPIKSKATINEIENKISELKQRHTEVQGRRTYEIRAPIAGTVTGLQAKPGQAASNNTPLLAIIPKDAKLQVELYVPSRAIGFVTEGQTVRIRYSAFPYRRFGVYEGKIVVISKHVLLPSELQVPLDTKEPVYRVTVEIDQQSVSAYGQEFPLQAGMSLEADIILEKQTLFEWIMDPLISLKGRF